jgi:4-diphosphocytidyl-2-C-methyl-D-erythritol kinase
MIQFPNAKINLGLNIVSKREDGFHDLETVFYPISLFDALEFIVHDSLEFQMEGIEIPGSNDDNLVLKAYHLLKKNFPSLPNISIQLLKRIPTGAGLGGGSADASFMLMMLNKYFQLEISKIKIKEYALQLGSDCPYFIENTPCFALSRGEFLEPITLDLSQYYFVIVKPDIHISTAWAFSKIEPNLPKKSCKVIVQQEISTWKYELLNDFEKPILDEFPEMLSIKNTLYKEGALYASMSGSGSSFFGIFEQEISNKKEFESKFSKSASVLFCKH